MNADGSGLTRLTDHPEDDQFPTWSPDGQQIAFGSLRDGGGWHIYVMNTDGSGLRRIASGSEPDWSH
jgi:TolB protein